MQCLGGRDLYPHFQVWKSRLRQGKLIYQDQWQVANRVGITEWCLDIHGPDERLVMLSKAASRGLSILQGQSPGKWPVNQARGDTQSPSRHWQDPRARRSQRARFLLSLLWAAFRPMALQLGSSLLPRFCPCPEVSQR